MREDEPVLPVLSVRDREIILEKEEILPEKRQYGHREIYNDLNDDLWNFWDQVQNNADELVARLRALPVSRNLYYDYYERLFDGSQIPKVQRAVMWFYVLRFTGTGWLRDPPGGWNNTESNALAFRSALDLFKPVQDRLLHPRVILDDRDVERVIEEYGSPKTLMYCLVPGTLIRTVDERFVPIERMRVGEIVAPNRVVKETMQRRYQGKVRTLRVQGLPDSLTTTIDHRFVSIPKRTHGRQETRDHDQLWEQRRVVPASEIEVGDYLLVPLGGIEAEVQWKWNDESRIRGKRKDGIHFTPRAELYRFLGYYTAEGHLEYTVNGIASVVTLSFNTNEINTFIADVIQCCKTAFGIEPSLRRGPSSDSVTQVVVRSTSVAEFVQTYIQGKAKNKALHPDLLTAPFSLQKEILVGWLRGDGSYQIDSRNRVKLLGTTASEQLARQMYLLALRCGLRPSFKTRWIRKDLPWMRERGEVSDEMQQYFDVYFAMEDASRLGWPVPSQRFSSKRRIIHNHMLVRVVEITEQDYDGLVYDIDVDGDNLFVANYTLVHNCDPPYRGAEYYYRIGSKGYAKKVFDHRRLAEILNAAQGHVVLSYYPYPELDEWYPPDCWRRMAWQQHKPSSLGAEGEATEFLLMNYSEHLGGLFDS